MKLLIPIIIIAAAILTYSIWIQPSVDTEPLGTTAVSPSETVEDIANYPLSMEQGYKYPLLLEGGYWQPCGAGECE